MDDQYIICRMCLVVLDRDFRYLDDPYGFNNSTTIRDALQFCLPEIDSYVSTQPVICLPCLTILSNFHNFKAKCLDSENKIKDYIKNNNLVDYNQVNLNCVVKERHRHETNRLPMKFFHESEMGFDVGENYHRKESEILLSCNKCSFVTTETNKFREHVCDSAEYPTTEYHCTKCPFSTDNGTTLDNHMNHHKLIDRVPCDICGFKAKDAGSLKRHKNNVHFKKIFPKELKCPKCPYIASNTPLFHKHLLRHETVSMVPQPAIYNCEYCSYETKDRSNFKKHTYIHIKDTQNKCNFCDYHCVSPYQMRRHIKVTHGHTPTDAMFTPVPHTVGWVGHAST